MAIQLRDRILTLCTTVGTNDAIVGATKEGYQGWEGITYGNTVYYCITDSESWEVGYGNYLDRAGTPTIQRNVLSSSNADEKLDLSGNSSIFCTYPAEKALIKNVDGNLYITDTNIQAKNITSEKLTADEVNAPTVVTTSLLVGDGAVGGEEGVAELLNLYTKDEVDESQNKQDVITNEQETKITALENKVDVLEDSSEFKAQYLEKEPDVLGSEPDTGCFYMLDDANTIADSYANATSMHMSKEDTLGVIHGIELLVEGQQLSLDEGDGESFGRFQIVTLEDKGSSVLYTLAFANGRGQATSGEVVSVKAFPEVDIDDKADKTYVDAQDNLKADITYVDSQDDKKLNLTGGDITGKVSLQSAALFVNGPNVGSANNFAVRDANGNNSFLVQGTPGGVFIDGKKVATQEYVTNNSGAGLANSTATLYNATCGYRLGTTGLGVEEFYINNENASGITEIGFLNLYNYLGNRIAVSGYVLTRGGEVEIYRRDSNQVVYRGIVKSKRIAGTGGATSKDILVLGITSLLYTDHKFVNNGMQSYAVKVSGLQT